MREREKKDNGCTRFVAIDELQQYTGLGKATASKIGKECGASIKIGRRVVYDLHKIDAYFESLAG